MKNKLLVSSVLCLLLCNNSFLQGDENLKFQSEKTIALTEQLKKDYDLIYVKFAKTLANARKTELKKENIKELERIVALLEKDMTIQPKTFLVKSAKSTYQNDVIQLSKAYFKKLNSQIKSALSNENMEEAKLIKQTALKINKLVAYRKLISKNIKINADNSPQKSGINVAEGASIDMSATGKWSPGQHIQFVRRRREWKQVYGDADEYKIQVKIGEGKTKAYGKKSHFIVKESGELYFFIKKYNRIKGSPKGKLSLKIKIYPPDSFPKLQELILALFEANVKAEDDSVETEIPEDEESTSSDEISNQGKIDGFVPPPPE